MKKGIILLTGTLVLLSFSVFAGNGMHGQGRNNNSSGYGNCMNNYNNMNYEDCEYTENSFRRNKKNNKKNRQKNKIMLGRDQEIHKYFLNKYDIDKNGRIDGDERDSFIKEHDELIQKFDKDNDGNLSEEERNELKTFILNK